MLFKNPHTDAGLYFKPLKNGVVVGNAVSAHTYEVVFQDTKYSYLPEESNQIDFQSYCSPLTVLQVCNELFTHLLKEPLLGQFKPTDLHHAVEQMGFEVVEDLSGEAITERYFSARLDEIRHPSATRLLHLRLNK